MKTHLYILLGVVLLLTGCRSVRQPASATGPHFRILTYNVNWGAPCPELAMQMIRDSRADIVCLQETTPEWEELLREELSRDFPTMEFHTSMTRRGGGLAFLTRFESRDVAYIPSETGWFDGWIREFKTPVGAVQVLNLHLRPPVGNRGSFTPAGYFLTGKDRLQEVQRFYANRRQDLPILVVGDFNDVERGQPLAWLKAQGLTNALGEFAPRANTWEWRVGWITLSRRMDHILYPKELRCCSSEVRRGGASDHFPVLAEFEAER